MKYLLTILLLSSIRAFATTYYVANAGSNSNNGTTAGTPFATITKALSVVVAGDNILLNKGDTWNERIVPPTSGTVGNVITIGAYGTGNKPIVTGLQTVTGFTNIGNIWTATATNSVKKLNTVLTGGGIKAKARTPNTGYYTFSSYSGLYQITGSLSGTPNYTGAECVVRSAPWVLDVVKIASQSGGVLTFRDSITYPAGEWGGNGYFIQNVNSALDTLGEWTFDSTSKSLSVYATSSPSVQISTTDTLVWLSKKSYLTFDGISFIGANIAAFQFDSCTNIVVQNCSVNYSGAVAFCGLNSSHISILNDSIQNSLSGAIYLRNVGLENSTINTCDSALIQGNYIHNTAILPGMGMSGNERYFAINEVGIGTVIRNNFIDSVGYMPISFNGRNTQIKNNFISTFGFVKDDVGGIYSYLDVWFPSYPNDGSSIIGNIIQNGIGAKEGTSFPTGAASGIYMDDSCKNVTVDSNSVSNCILAGLFIHNAANITARWNNLFNNGNQIYIGGTSSKVFNNSIKYNKLFASAGQYVTVRDYYDTNENIDSNYISRFPTEGNFMSNQTSAVSLTIWRNGTGWDRHSSVTPDDITLDPVLYYSNPSMDNLTVNIGQTYKDFNGTSANSWTIAPYQSVILFKALNQIIPVVPPNRTIEYLPINIR